MDPARGTLPDLDILCTIKLVFFINPDKPNPRHLKSCIARRENAGSMPQTKLALAAAANKGRRRALAGDVDYFPLSEVKGAADRLLRGRSAGLWRRRGVVPRSTECDVLFANELVLVKGELALREVAILTCLHLLSCFQARG